MNEKLMHTSGPWFTKRELFSTVYVEARIGGGMLQEVAACGPTEAGQEQQEANARLIALAPELLNAVRKAIAALETCNSGDYSTGHVIHASFDEAACHEALIACSDAYAKATGKTSEAA